ncbi:IclR family transcriptional regulator [Bordetella sp. 15P40C-2]|uniref:IclR family transcriptional regulator n=1 Tax=Bordetella sp. 15P40C-2 TaxID=2572246 RepID=UPI0013277294|nr:IclR family transcriptional regulator [Bordetella sp. 15P40C-2]MVW73239.1 helix-turn-helix domain-containing protein [Bordetella sp. 15P40C-2]
MPSPRDPNISPEPSGRGRRQRVQAAETGTAILKALGELGGRASLTLIATHIGESPAKVHRYLASLIAGGLVDQDAVTQQYFLGLETLLLGLAAMRQADPIRLAEASLIRLREELEVTCFIAVMGNKGPTIVRFEEPALPVTVNVRVGSVLPLLWSATGRALLAALDDKQMLAMAEHEVVNATPTQRAMLESKDPIGHIRDSVRSAGCASVRDTNLPGISAVAAPLLDYTGRPRAVLTALGASGGFDPSPTGAIAQAVRREARAISQQMGYVE